MKRSLASLCIILVISLPGLFFHRGDLSFNSMKEINKDNQSIQGANIVAGSFGKGETMPTTAVITTIKPLDSPQGLAFIDDVHQCLQDIQGVVKVYGPTRPLGQRIDKFYYNEQAKEMNIGLERSVKGLNHVSLGLQKASTNIPDSSTGGFSNITRLVRGTSAIMGHLAQTQKALATIQLGLKAGANQSTTLLKGAHQLEENLKIISARTEQLYEGYQQIAQTFTLMNQEYVLLAELVAAMKGTADEIDALSNLLDPSNDVGNQIKVKAGTLRQQVSSLEDRLVKVHDPFTTTVNLLNQANAQLKIITDLNKQMAQGASEITQGVEALSLGMKQGAKGEELIAGGLSKVQGGLQSVNDGQKGLHKKISRFSSRLGELKQGLHKSAQGVDHISTGINQANRYLSQVSHQGPPALFIPKEVREGKEFRDALNMYMANDRKSVKWMITLDADPYSEKAMGIAKKIQDTMRRIKSENNAILEQGVGGISSINVDLHWISSRDFLQAFILMFAGIGVYLLFLFRSSWITLSTLISLIVAYYSSLSITERIFINGLGEDGLSWTVPFLSFVMLIALGVDYSIFLVMRFKEYHEMKPLPAIEKAVTFTGRAVISAMIILSGTCASLYPSGVNTLMQIATVVIIGLVLLTLLLPLLVPLVIKVREMLKRKSSN